MAPAGTDVVAAMAHREQIRELIGRYCERLDEYDIAEVAATFTPDAVADYGPGRGGVLEGREAIAARIATGQAAFARTHHQVGQISIELIGDAASATTTVLAWHERHDGTRDLLGLRYIDRLESTVEGWRIHRRRVEVTIVDGFEGVEWYHVARRPPSPDQSPGGSQA